MEHKFNSLKSDLRTVFVEGTASSFQIARVFLILAVPAITACLVAMRHIIY